MPIPFSVRLHKQVRQGYLNGEDWDSKRLERMAMQSKNGRLHCGGCGRPLEPHQSITHHLRYPSKERPLVMARDTLCVCGKCHEIIRQNPEMQNPTLSKRGLIRLITERLALNRKTHHVGRMFHI